MSRMVKTLEGITVDSNTIEEMVSSHFTNEAMKTRNYRVVHGYKNSWLQRLCVRDVDKRNDEFFKEKANEIITKWRKAPSIFLLPFEVAERVMKKEVKG